MITSVYRMFFRKKMRITEQVVRRAFLCCLLLPLVGFVSIILVGHRSQPSVSEDKSEPKKRTKRQDPGIGDSSPLAYEAKSSR